jgi:hypothetical protein
VVSAVHGFAGPGRPSPEAIDRDANHALIQAAADAGVQLTGPRLLVHPL